ncbi:MAG TPA: M20/M25/M40 family metallo-hydrolase [Novosphingobium sp.]|nr:M20/M25/M40 family metallo-hydrolase [Novosphingobium sp.]
MKISSLLAAGAALAAAVPALATPADDRAIAAIVDEGTNRSQALTLASELMDGIGPRLTNSDNFYRAEEWALARFRGWNLANVGTESWDFGLGWNPGPYSAAMIEPRMMRMTAIPVAWSPPTGGAIRAAVVVAPMSKLENFEQWKGKLAGKIVLTSLPGTSSEPDKASFRRLDDAEIAKLDQFDLPSFDPGALERSVKSRKFAKQLSDFLKAEGALAMVKISYRDGMLVHGEGYAFQPGQTLAVPTFELAAEDYRRLVRLSQAGRNPVVELASEARFDSGRLTSDNIFAEIPGTDPKAGYVMAGAHFDSWIAGDGASDNGAGSVVVMEAARILSQIGVRPKRTIRFALWSGEEQGLLGSRAYIEKHLATRPVDPSLDPIAAMAAWRTAFPIETRPGYGALKAYFNMDNGSGRFRGIYAEGNLAAAPILAEWLAPFRSMGAGKVVARKTGGTDHVFMQSIGVPAYQFIPDPLDYDSRVHHSNLDTVDHMRGDDLRQAAVIMAGMLLQAANSDKDLPRPPLPTQPDPTDPFKVTDPNE